MGVSAGPDVSESGLVLALDGANYKSFKGQSATNLYYIEAGSSANNSIFHMPMGGTATGSYTTSHSYGSWSGNTIFKVTVSSGTLAGGYESFRSCVSSSFDSTYGTTRRLSAKVKMLKGSITSLSYHSGGGTGGHNSSHYTPISESSVPTDVLSKDGWYQFDMDVSGSYPYGHCVGIGIVGSDIEFLVTEMMLYPSSSFIRFTPTTRGTTVATGGGWADLTGRGNNGELVNGTRESSDNLGALVFDGTNDKVIIPYNSNLNPSNVTISVWFKRNSSVNYSHFAGLPASNTSWNSPYVSYGIEFIGTTDQPALVLGFSDNTFSYTTASASASTAVGLWVNVVGTYDKSFSKIYVNGQLITSNVETKTLFSTSANFVLGTETQDTSGYPLNGNIAQVQVYNRALTAAEIQQNFNANRARFGI